MQDFIRSQKKYKMKEVCNEDFLQGWQELSAEESAGITGGESLWYWVGFGLGTVVRFISQSSGGQTSGQNLMNAGLG